MTTHDRSEKPLNPRPEPAEKDRNPEDNDAPELPPTEPEPVPVEDPPDAPGKRGPYVVD